MAAVLHQLSDVDGAVELWRSSAETLTALGVSNLEADPLPPHCERRRSSSRLGISRHAKQNNHQ